MQLIPASERVSLRFIVVVAAVFCATTLGLLLLFALYSGSGTEDARSTPVQTASTTIPPALPAPAIASEPVSELAAAALAVEAPPSVRATVASGAKPNDARPAADSVAAVPAGSPTMRANSAIKQYQGSPLDERLLFYPVKYPTGDWQPRGLKVDDAWFTSSDGVRLHGWYCPSDEQRAVILYLHGNGGNITDEAALYRFFGKHLHATVLAFDYRGYGRSQGRPTVDGVIGDARAARAWLAAKAGVPESAVVLVGRSLGGAVAVQLTTDIRPRGLVLENTFASLRAMAEHHVPALAGLVPTDKLDSASILARYDGPLLQCHADADRTVPFASGEELYRAAKGKKEFFRAAGIDHNDRLPDEYYGKLMEFVTTLP